MKNENENEIDTDAAVAGAAASAAAPGFINTNFFTVVLGDAAAEAAAASVPLSFSFFISHFHFLEFFISMLIHLLILTTDGHAFCCHAFWPHEERSGLCT